MLMTPSSERYFAMYEALRKGASVDEIHEITKVKHYFIEQMKELVEEEEALAKSKGRLPEDQMLIQAKKDGFSDKYLSQILDITEDEVREKRISWVWRKHGKAFMSAARRITLITIPPTTAKTKIRSARINQRS